MIRVTIQHEPDDLTVPNADEKITSQTFIQSDNMPDWMILSYAEDVLKNIRQKVAENQA